jgi:putative redox protein
MTRLQARARLVENFRVDVDDRRSHTVALDLEPPDGKDMGPSALELCVMSLIGCYEAIFLLTSQKMRFTVKNLEVKVDAFKSEQVGTITRAAVDVLVESNMPEDRIQRAHELTVKDCPVGKLFEKAGVEIQYNVRTRK